MNVLATVLVVEDEPAIQELIAVNLEAAGYRVLRAESVVRAYSFVRDAIPDLVLLDWMLPDGSGVLFAEDLRGTERTRHVPIIMLTARSSESDKIVGLDAGADDYVTKPFSPRELVARIRAILRRCAPDRTDDPARFADLELDPNSRQITAADRAVKVGPTEFRLLHFLMTHPERVFSRKQLLDEVWGDHVFIEERTVDVHIRRLRHALEPTGRDKLIQTVHGTGYRLSQVSG